MDVIKTKEQQKRVELDIKNQRETRINDLRKVLETPQGRRFFWSVLCECGVYDMPPMNKDAIFYFEGKRSIGLALIARLNQVNPELFYQIAKENNNG